MAFKDRVLADIRRVFIDFERYADWHSWNGEKLLCVTDEDMALKRKNNNVVDVSWDNNTTETLLYAPVDGFPGRVEPNEQIFFDGQYMKILQRQIDEGMYTIVLVSNEVRSIGL